MNHTRYQPIITRITPRLTWEDLNLPPPRLQVLRDIAVLAGQNRKPRGYAGFPAPPSRVPGISARFAGGSGTGRGTAAEVIAHELGVDLYRIDLSQVVSRYIGETEKNLRSLFDAAEDSGAILFFDEADALFGKRSEIHDSHDRYAGIGLNYLLGQMERFRGLAILSTALQDPPDPAFTRCFRFVVRFPAGRDRPRTGKEGRITMPGWQGAEDIDGSGPDDRHFVVDYDTGTIRFGNGETGRIPVPQGDDSCLCRYRTGTRDQCPVPRWERNRYYTGKLLTVSDEGDALGGSGEDKGEDVEPFERNRYFYGKLLTVRDFSQEQEYQRRKPAGPIRFVPGSLITTGIQYTGNAGKSRNRCCRNIRCSHTTNAATTRETIILPCRFVTITGELADPSACTRFLQLKGLVRLQGAGHRYDGTCSVDRVSHGIRNGRWTEQVILARTMPSG